MASASESWFCITRREPGGWRSLELTQVSRAAGAFRTALGQASQEVADTVDDIAEAGEDGLEYASDCVDDGGEDIRHDGDLSKLLGRRGCRALQDSIHTNRRAGIRTISGEDAQ